MLRIKVFLGAAVLLCGLSELCAQSEGVGLKVFGYFQASFGRGPAGVRRLASKSFSLQQLNLFLQKDLAPRWTMFANFEFVNSYSSFRNWGAQKLEEAWVNYYGSKQFAVKLGLQVPTFNNLNAIKNKTPLMPYIIRPLAYESSFNEIIALEEFTPTQAFVQAYGFIPSKALKFDYALFLGNSPNINADPRRDQTGVDTTRYFLFGGRFGIRTKNENFKIGISGTLEQVDFYHDAKELGYDPAQFTSVPRLRLGGDLSLSAGKWLCESELIRVTYDDDHPALELDKEFYYGTLKHEWSERLKLYAGYWVTRENRLPQRELDIFALTAGAAYDIINGMISAKAQYGRVRFESSTHPRLEGRANYYFLAMSVMFE